MSEIFIMNTSYQLESKINIQRGKPSKAALKSLMNILIRFEESKAGTKGTDSFLLSA